MKMLKKKLIFRELSKMPYDTLKHFEFEYFGNWVLICFSFIHSTSRISHNIFLFYFIFEFWSPISLSWSSLLNFFFTLLKTKITYCTTVWLCLGTFEKTFSRDFKRNYKFTLWRCWECEKLHKNKKHFHFLNSFFFVGERQGKKFSFFYNKNKKNKQKGSLHYFLKSLIFMRKKKIFEFFV